MAMQTSTDSNDNLLMAYFEKKAIATLHDKVAFYQLAEKFPLPKNSGLTITFNGWRSLTAASGTLSEFSTSANAAVRLSSRKISATIGSYGRAIQFTDLLESTSILPVEPGALRELEQSAALTADNVIQLAAFKVGVQEQAGSFGTSLILSAWLSSKASAFCANTSTASYNAESAYRFGFPVVFATSAATLSATHHASANVGSISAMMGPIGVRKAVNRLKRLNVEPMAGGRYVGVAHPNAIGTMLANPDWKQWKLNYADGTSGMYKHSAGIVHNVEFIESSNCPRFEGAGTANHKCNLTLIVGKGALAVTELDGGVKMIMKRPGPQSTDNVYDLFSTLSFKLRAAAAVLNPSCGVILISQELA